MKDAVQIAIMRSAVKNQLVSMPVQISRLHLHREQRLLIPKKNERVVVFELNIEKNFKEETTLQVNGYLIVSGQCDTFT